MLSCHVNLAIKMNSQDHSALIAFKLVSLRIARIRFRSIPFNVTVVIVCVSDLHVERPSSRALFHLRGRRQMLFLSRNWLFWFQRSSAYHSYSYALDSFWNGFLGPTVSAPWTEGLAESSSWFSSMSSYGRATSCHLTLLVGCLRQPWRNLLDPHGYLKGFRRM